MSHLDSGLFLLMLLLVAVAIGINWEGRRCVLAVEMEAAALYTLAAGYDRRALAICTVSDHIVTGEHTSSAEREQTFTHMVEIALEAMLGA